MMMNFNSEITNTAKRFVRVKSGAWGRWLFLIAVFLAVTGAFPGTEARAQDDSDSDSDSASESGSYESFRLLLDRNIFDANRRRPIPPSERRPEPPPPPRQETFSLVGVFMNGQEKVAFFEGSDREWSGSRKVGESIADFIIREVEFSHASLERIAEPVAMDSDPEENATSSEISGSSETGNDEVSESQTIEAPDEPEEKEDETLVVALLELPVGQGMSRRGDDPWELTENPAFSRSSFGSGSSGFGRRSFGSDRGGSEGSSASETGESENSETEDSGSDSDSDAGGGMSDILKQMMERRKQEMNK